jgi:hypothetical protein
MTRLENIFVAIWCIVMPITGTVLIPVVQGTIPAYMMAFLSVILVFNRVQSGEMPAGVLRYVQTFIGVFLIWLLLMICSQIGLMISGRHDFGWVNMIDMDDTSVLFRRTMFTQSLYFLACVLIALYFWNFYKPRWRRYIHWGGYFLAGYGIYEWTYFLIFHQPGDFLVNRAFGEHTASWSQTIAFGPIALLRIKSTLGEPTFFAAAVLPYLFFALDDRKVVLSAMLLFTAIFSTSTALFVTLPVVLLLKSFWSGKIRWDYLFVLGLVALALGVIALLYPDTFRGLFIDKFNGDNESGAERMENAARLNDLFGTFTIPNWIFGIGFGYAYLTIYGDLIVNTGLIGVAVFAWVFIRPAILLPTTPGYEGLKAGLISILILSALSLSEFYLPTTWMFLGVIWYYLTDLKRQRAQAPVAPHGMAAAIGAPNPSFAPGLTERQTGAPDAPGPR